MSETTRATNPTEVQTGVDRREAHAGVLPFVVTRVFAAPPERVFDAFTQRDELLAWFGPAGMPLSIATLDLRPGGTFHYGMRAPNGQTMWGRFVYRAIERPSRIVLVNAFSDDKAGLGRHPMSPTWPRELLSTTTFEREGDGTRLSLSWAPLEDATEAECATFDAGRESMAEGWTNTFAQLAAHLGGA